MLSLVKLLLFSDAENNESSFRVGEGTDDRRKFIWVLRRCDVFVVEVQAFLNRRFKERLKHCL